MKLDTKTRTLHRTKIIKGQLDGLQKMIDSDVVRLTYMIEADLSKITLSDEHLDYKWVTIDSFESINMEPYLERVLKDIQ